MTHPLSVEEYFNVMKLSQDGRYSAAAAVAFLFVDIIWTLRDEIPYIWRRPQWSTLKVAYLLGRYWAIIFLSINLIVSTRQPMLEFCKRYLYFYSFGGEVFYVAIVNTVATLRVYALYESSKWVLLFFILTSCWEVSMLFYGFWWSLELPFSSKNIISIPYDYPVGCLAFIAPEARSRTLILWIPTVVGSFLFLAFTMYRFFESIRDDDGTLNLKNCLRPKNISPIMIILAQDGARCYFVILVTTALRAVFLYHYAGVYPMIMHWHLVIYCTASSRLVLILRAGAGLPTKFVSGLPEQSRLDFKKATTNTTNWDSTLPTDTRLVFNYSLNTKGANGNGVA